MNHLCRALPTVGLLGVVAATAVACSKAPTVSHSVSVFSVRAGECFAAPSKVQAQLSSLKAVLCSQPHTQEAYAVVPYQQAGGSPSASASAVTLTTSYPGDDVLTSFAQGVCAQRFTKYVGIDYLDSRLFFTYLLPSPRSWSQGDDRDVICFATTTGSMLTASVKGSRK